MTAPLIRHALPRDLDTLLDLIRDFHTIEHLAYERETIRGILSQLLAKPSLGQLWVMEKAAEREGALIGYALLGYGFSIEYGGRDAFLDELYLVPEFRGQGHGQCLLEWVTQNAGVSVIHLEVDNDNERAFEVYKRFGFKPKNRRMLSFWGKSVKF